MFRPASSEIRLAATLVDPSPREASLLRPLQHHEVEVVEVLLRPCALISRKDPRFEGYGATAMVDAFEESLVKYVVASAAWR